MLLWWGILALRYTLGTVLIGLFLPFSSFLKKRRALEREWGLSRIEKTDFSVWFHVSSEGELEQIMPWVEAKYQKREEMLILFTSPSLVNRAKHLHSPEDGIYFACFSLAHFFTWSSNSIFRLPLPKEFFMVRYDFFPELVFLARKVKRSVLLAGTLKGKKEKLSKPLFKFWSRVLFSSFQKIFTSTVKDREAFEKLLAGTEVELEDLDFRHGQILKRQKDRQQLELQVLFPSIEKQLNSVPWHKRIIFGSLWPNELTLFNDEFFQLIKEEELLLFLAPHHLKGKNWDEIFHFMKVFEEKGLKTFLWENNSSKEGLHESRIILCQIPGLLCEIYPLFGHSYIGGGHGRSVHSLLEPYWGGGHLYFGPKTHRSTEFDFVQDESPKQQHIVRELDNFYHILRQNLEASVDRDFREKLAGALIKKQQQVF